MVRTLVVEHDHHAEFRAKARAIQFARTESGLQAIRFFHTRRDLFRKRDARRLRALIERAPKMSQEEFEYAFID